MWQLLNILASGTRHLRENNSLLRIFHNSLAGPFVFSVCSGGVVAAAVMLARTVATTQRCSLALSGLQQREMTRTCWEYSVLDPTLQQAPWAFAGLPQIFRKTGPDNVLA